MPPIVRPTKKQRELLDFINAFISEHGYSPSYREIMNGANYNSVATVALHVNNLIRRGHLVKRGRSARSLEVVAGSDAAAPLAAIAPGEERWLVERVEQAFWKLEQSAQAAANEVDQLYVLVGALKVLGLEAAARSFIPRLSGLEGNPPAVTDGD